MISQLDDIEKIKPLFREYLNYMSQFFEIADHNSWCEGAIKNLHRYLDEDDRHIYILNELDAIIGFALVNKHLRFNHNGFAVAEFFVQKKHERKNYGRRLAEYVFETFPGDWEVAVSIKNNLARAFWKQVISSYTNSEFMEKKRPSFSGYGFVFNNA